MNNWQLYRYSRFDPAMNMALDDVLLQHVGQTGNSIRFYGWEEPCFSIGYFQPAQVAPCGYAFVRRPSGGGVVDHRNDFTFSLVFSAESPLYQVDRFESYRIINQAVADALADLGIETRLTSEDIADDVNRHELICFATPAKHDVLASGGRKLCGGAQRRRRHGMLHQGSIVLGKDDQRSVDELEMAILQAFRKLGIGDPAEREYSEELLEEAKLLARQRYASDSWNRKK